MSGSSRSSSSRWLCVGTGSRPCGRRARRPGGRRRRVWTPRRGWYRPRLVRAGHRAAWSVGWTPDRAQSGRLIDGAGWRGCTMTTLRRVGAAVALLLTVVVLAACGEVKQPECSRAAGRCEVAAQPGHEELHRVDHHGRAVQAGPRAERLHHRHSQERRRHGGPRREAPVRRDRRLPRVHRPRRVCGRRRERDGQVGRGVEQDRPRPLRHARRGGERGDPPREHRNGDGDVPPSRSFTGCARSGTCRSCRPSPWVPVRSSRPGSRASPGCRRCTG